VLDDNIETLLRRLERVGVAFPLIKEALDKDRDARDSVFSGAAKSPEARRAVREVPSFDRLVRRLATWLAS